MYLDLGVIWGNAKPHQAKGHRQRFVHVDLGILDFGHGPVGRVESGRTGADDSEPERPAIAGGLGR
jgi:hypothetical protein